MKKRGTAMQHVLDDMGRCVICGQLTGPGECPGPPAESDVEHDFKPPGEGFTTPPECEAFTHDPDLAAAGNLLCPVCASRPCLAGCRLGFSHQDLEDLNAHW